METLSILSPVLSVYMLVRDIIILIAVSKGYNNTKRR